MLLVLYRVRKGIGMSLTRLTSNAQQYARMGLLSLAALQLTFNTSLSRYIRRVEAGERVAVTARGRVVAELCPPPAGNQAPRQPVQPADSLWRNHTSRRRR